MSDAGAMDPSAGPASSGIDKSIESEIKDALYLLDFAVASGFKSTDGLSVPEDVMAAIKSAARAMAAGSAANLREGEGDAWVRFELAYQRLAALVSPVTADTLRATEETDESWWSTLTSDFEVPGAAHRFTQGLWIATAIFALFIVLSSWGVRRYGPILDGDVPDNAWNTWLQLAEILIPFAYGGLGACAYLLRSAHEFIHKRSFDTKRRPEYRNRVLLGVISGGTITLFINQVTGDDGEVIHLSAAALGFIAGYSTDFLFNTIERLVQAIMPKVGLDTIRGGKASARLAGDPLNLGLSLKELLAQHAAATDPDDKALYKSLIEKFRDKL